MLKSVWYGNVVSVNSLLRLLVILAIGILVSILFPSLSIAKGTAISSVCVSQVKQLGYAPDVC